MSETTIGLLVLLTYTAVLCLIWLFCRGIIDPSVLGGKSSEEYVRDVRDRWGDSEWPPSLDDGMLGPRDMTRWPRRDWLPGEWRE
jgi:hypothetical protein